MRVDLGRPSLHGETRRGSKKLKQVVSQIRWIDAQTHRHSEYSIGVGRTRIALTSEDYARIARWHVADPGLS